jgi:hypothetical protein
MQDKSNTLHGYILKPNFVEIHCAQWLIVSERRKFGLVLLRHKRKRFVCLICRVQQGQRERFRAMATISLRRIVAIEFGM